MTASRGEPRAAAEEGGSTEHWDAIAQQRRALADQLEGLTDAQWESPSLCDAWSVHDVAAHLVAPHITSMLRFVGDFIVARGSFDRANQAMTSRVATHSNAELVALLREHAESRFTPPGHGSIAPLTDVLIHGQDIRIPLELTTPGPVEPWGAVLSFLCSRKARRGFLDRALPDVRFVATDLEWSSGAGDEVHGRAQDLGTSIMGRPAALASLTGPGVATLSEWISR